MLISTLVFTTIWLFLSPASNHRDSQSYNPDDDGGNGFANHHNAIEHCRFTHLFTPPRYRATLPARVTFAFGFTNTVRTIASDLVWNVSSCG